MPCEAPVMIATFFSVLMLDFLLPSRWGAVSTHPISKAGADSASVDWRFEIARTLFRLVDDGVFGDYTMVSAAPWYHSCAAWTAGAWHGPLQTRARPIP